MYLFMTDMLFHNLYNLEVQQFLYFLKIRKVVTISRADSQISSHRMHDYNRQITPFINLTM